MPKFLMTELILVGTQTARLGAGTGSANFLTDKEVGKAVKLVADSRYDLCAAGDPIDRFINSVDVATSDNYTTGAVMGTVGDRKEVTFDGLEATAGTGTIAVGDYVVCGTVVAKGTALSAPPKVCKATNQPGVAVTVAAFTAITEPAAASDVDELVNASLLDIEAKVEAALVKVADAQANAMAAWKVVSLGSAGTGAVGTVGVIERVA